MCLFSWRKPEKTVVKKQDSLSIRTAGTIFCFFFFAIAGGMVGLIATGMKLMGLGYGAGIGSFVGGLFGYQAFSGYDQEDKPHRCRGFNLLPPRHFRESGNLPTRTKILNTPRPASP